MKKCPKCQLLFSDDNLFCVDDGTTLILYAENAGEGYASGNNPTQVIHRPAAQTTSVKDSTKWLYLVIGVLVTALIVVGVVFFITVGEEERTENSTAGSNTEYKTVKPQNSPAPANNTSATNPAVNAPVPAQPAVRLNPAGGWTGDWNSPSGAYLTLNVGLSDDGAGNVQGQIEWTLQRTLRPEKMSKIGMTAIEYVKGKYDPLTRSLTMSGYRKDDPNNVLVMVDDYRLSLSADDRTLNGAAKNGGKWDGKVRLQRK